MPKKDEAKSIYIISTVAAVAPVTSPVKKAGSDKTRDDRRPAALVPVNQTVATIGVDAFAANIENTTGALREIFAQSFNEAFGEYSLDEVEVDLEISADGKVGFFGSSVGVKGSSSLKLKFKRKKDSA